MSAPALVGESWTDRYPAGRFEVHFAKMDDLPHVSEPVEVSVVAHSTEREWTARIDAEVYLVSAARSVVFVVVDYRLHTSGRSIVDHLYMWCRNRHRLRIDGILLSDWLLQFVPTGTGTDTGEDVLQVVDLDGGSASALVVGGRPTPLAAALVGRSTSDSTTMVDLPTELNTRSDRSLVHGRGVIATVGMPDSLRHGTLMVTLRLLFAVAEVRRVSDQLAARARRIVQDDNHAGPRESAISELRDDMREVRGARVDLVSRVVPTVLGVDTPDRVLDSVRESFARALRLDAIVEGVNTMLETLSEVIASRIEELELESTLRLEMRQRQWQFIVSTVSGVVLPWALVLAYFGINGAQVDSAVSIIDWSRYWYVWVSAGAAMLCVITISMIRYRRYLRE
ncbi:MAG TPA: hypothetical protein VM820_15710 [Vicinamibacterales bacterium]|nr:hypothetical protein [Vicinamibacterales bacterium]